MKNSDAKALVAVLIAAFPRSQWPPSTQKVYSAALEPFMFEDGRRAVERLVVTSSFPPAIAEIRGAIIEDSLGLPSDVEAWELALAHADARRPGAPKKICLACAGFGTATGGEGECPTCRGVGELEELDFDRMPPIPAPIPRAVASVGGWRAFRESTRPDLLRRDFLAAYATFRRGEVERENLRLSGARVDSPLVEAAVRAAIEAAP